MTKLVVLTRSSEKKITEDWQREIPTLAIYQPRWLLRRVGPLLVGICLDRDSSGEIYKPIFHVHCLCASDISLTLGTQLRAERSGGPSYVEVKWHEQKYKEEAARMVRQALLPFEGDLRLGQILRAYRTYMTTPLGKRLSASLYRDMILFSAWTGDRDGSRSLLAECLGTLVDEANYRHLRGKKAFEVQCRKLIETPSLMQETVDAQIIRLGVGHLPVSSLTL